MLLLARHWLLSRSLPSSSAQVLLLLTVRRIRVDMVVVVHHAALLLIMVEHLVVPANPNNYNECPIVNPTHS